MRWTYFAVCLQPEEFRNDFARALDAAEDAVVHRVVFDGYPNSGYAIARGLETTEAELIESILLHPTMFEAMHEAGLAAYERALHC